MNAFDWAATIAVITLVTAIFLAWRASRGDSDAIPSVTLGIGAVTEFEPGKFYKLEASERPPMPDNPMPAPEPGNPAATTCLVCGRILIGKRSIKQRMGRRCAAKARKATRID